MEGWKVPALIAAIGVFVFGFKGLFKWIIEVRDMNRLANYQDYLDGRRDRP